MGGGTTKVGDPSGRDETRQLLTDEQIDANIAGIREIFSRFFTFGDGPTDAIMANNDDWLGKLAVHRLSCARSAGISPSTACSPWTACACASSASSR